MLLCDLLVRAVIIKVVKFNMAQIKIEILCNSQRVFAAAVVISVCD